MLRTVCEAFLRVNDALRRMMLLIGFDGPTQPLGCSQCDSCRDVSTALLDICLGANIGTGRLCRVLSWPWG